MSKPADKTDKKPDTPKRDVTPKSKTVPKSEAGTIEPPPIGSEPGIITKKTPSN
jgi:hypothetical protein